MSSYLEQDYRLIFLTLYFCLARFDRILLLVLFFLFKRSVITPKQVIMHSTNIDTSGGEKIRQKIIKNTIRETNLYI